KKVKTEKQPLKNNKTAKAKKIEKVLQPRINIKRKVKVSTLTKKKNSLKPAASRTLKRKRN
uniref:hypothetical protein n=1 Tax=Salmonella sp. s51228 TaxID=3159652 RepID=UPI00397FBF42